MQLVYGLNKDLVDEKTFSLSEKYFNKVIFNEESKIEDFLLHLNSFSLFSKSEVIIVKSSSIFKNKSDEDRIINLLKKTREQNVIFVHYGRHLANSKIFKLEFLKKHEVKELSHQQFIRKLINDAKVKGINLDYSSCNLLIENLGHNYLVIMNEIQKLWLRNSVISAFEIKNSFVIKDAESNFDLINGIVENNNVKIVKNFYQQLESNYNASILVGQIVSVVSLAITISNYLNSGYSESEISKDLKIHAYRIKRTRQLLQFSNERKLFKLLEKIAKYDYDSKTGSIKSEIAFKHFLIHLLN